MKIWIQYEGEDLQMLKAVTGAIRGGVYLDGTRLVDEPLGEIAERLDEQDVHPVIRVTAALAAKKLHGGLAIIMDEWIIKSKPDLKTLVALITDEKGSSDRAIEKVLEFFKRHKIPSSI